MRERIKIIYICPKKVKSSDETNWKELSEEYAPGMYETIYTVEEKETIEQVTKHRPEIIILSDFVKDPLNLLKKLKQIHPETILFVLVSDDSDDEQEIIDEYMAAGAYKCILSPIIVDTLFHDMYVALNLE